MFDTNQDDSETFERDALAQDDEDMATVLRVCRENDALRAEAGLPPFAESTDAEDEIEESGGEGWCSICRTVHTAPCGSCGGHVFHRDGCPEVW